VHAGQNVHSWTQIIASASAARPAPHRSQVARISSTGPAWRPGRHGTRGSADGHRGVPARLSAVRFDPVADSRPDDVPWPAMSWPPAGDTELRGGTVVLTQFEPTRDAAELFTALDSGVVWRHVAGRPGDPAAMAQRLGDSIAAGRLPWVVRLVDGAVVGMSSYLEVSVPDARLEIGATAYSPSVWASAVNPETKLLLLTHAFEVLGAGRVQLKTDVRNVRSQQAIARLGAHYEGTLRRYQRRDDGTVRDTVLFAITAEDWPAVRDALRARLAGQRQR
jgi:RimJ/RimL family protein N-acetyltransferase